MLDSAARLFGIVSICAGISGMVFLLLGFGLRYLGFLFVGNSTGWHAAYVLNSYLENILVRFTLRLGANGFDLCRGKGRPTTTGKVYLAARTR